MPKHQATTYTETEVNNLLNTKAAISGQTFTGGITAPNLSGTNSGDQDLSGKANVSGQTFTGGISAPNLSGTNSGDQTNISGNAATATNVPYSGLTGSVPTWNQNTTGNAGYAASAGNASTVTTVTTAQVGGATAGTGPGQLGSYAMLFQTATSPPIYPGDIVAGSGYTYANADPNTSGMSPPGTWRCMGYSINSGSNSSRVTLYLRIS